MGGSGSTSTPLGRVDALFGWQTPGQLGTLHTASTLMSSSLLMQQKVGIVHSCWSFCELTADLVHGNKTRWGASTSEEDCRRTSFPRFYTCRDFLQILDFAKKWRKDKVKKIEAVGTKVAEIKSKLHTARG